MAFCSNCGQGIEDGARFCTKCGVAVNSNSTEQRKMVYEGEMHKCPNCGEVLKSFTTSCPTCGYEPRSVKTNSPVEELVKKIEKATSLNKKMELISNFYIPNTKEDIYDFFILAVSNLEDKYYDTDDAWRAKLEQAYHKARLSFGNTSDFEYLEKLYASTIKKVNKRERNIATIFRRNKTVIIVGSMVLGAIIMATIAIILGGDAGAALGFASGSLGVVAILLGMMFHEEEETGKIDDSKTSSTKAPSRLEVGFSSEDFVGQNWEAMVEELKEIGFTNIAAKPIKKKILEEEGDIRSIKISGQTVFSADAEFSPKAKIEIYYCAKNV